MKRRSFLKTTALASATLGMGDFTPGQQDKTHILTLSFDDGFRKSFLKIADIYEDYGLSACFNVIASGHKRNFKAVDQWILPELMGDFDDWNMLKSRGHEVMPHSWKHLNLAKQPVDEAQKLIQRCLDYFEAHLDGYDASYSVFNFPFNSSTTELEQFTMSKAGAVRTHGKAVNPIPGGPGPFRLGCASMGPDNIDDWVEGQVNKFLESAGGWLILNTHGLDEEGWGPMSTDFLISLIRRLVKIDYLEMLPTGEVVKRSLEER